jgi:hypothetical protein
LSRALHSTPGEGVKSQTIPSYRAANALAVYDGTTVLGYVVERDGSHFSFDQDGTLIGEFASRTLAMRSIPPPILLGKKRRRR